MFRKITPVPMCLRLFPTLSVSGFMQRSLIHLDLNFFQVDMNGSICILLHATVEPAPFVENAVSFPLDGFSSFVKVQVIVGVWAHFWVFSSIPLIYLSVAIPVPFSFYHNCSVVQLEVRDGDSTRSSFIVENSFCYPRFFVILDEFANCPFQLCEELSWNFDED